MSSPSINMADEVSPDLEKVVLEFSKVGVIKFGQFKLKSGVMSPIYIDLREIISYPSLLKTASTLVASTIYAQDAILHDVICGVPYAALPIATLLACENDVPMVMRRKEAKSYGTKKMVEGRVVAGNRCIIIDDVCSSGESILETVADLRAVGLEVTDAVVLLDRQSNGAENLSQQGIKLHAALNLTQICKVLRKAGQLSEATAREVETFMASCQEPRSVNGNGDSLSVGVFPSWKTMHFLERKNLAKNKIAKRLFEIMLEKETNLGVAADVTTSSALLALAEKVGGAICLLKIHVDILEDFSFDFVEKMKICAKKWNFLILEDRKFSDIGATVMRQFSGGCYRIAEWADLVTVHALPGGGVLDGLKQGMHSHQHSVGGVLVADMSSKGALTGPDYVTRSVKIAEEYRNEIVGFVTQTDLPTDPAFIRMTPGVHIVEGGDSLGQQYNTPEDVVGKCADVIIVGRGVTEAADPAAAAAVYKTRGFNAYRRRVEKL